MRLSHITLLVFLAMLALISATPTVMAQGETQASVEAAGFGSLLWTFANSPLGIALVSLAAATLIGRVLTKKPEWKRYVEKYKPTLIQAVKMAEKAIPDDVPEAGMKRLDLALRYVLNLFDAAERVPKLDEAVLAQALTAVHAELETGANLGAPPPAGE